MNDAESELQSNGYATENTVFEQGVAGFSELDVSAPYLVELTDSDGNVVSLPDSRIMSGQFPDLFGVNGVVGMPAMVGRVVSFDETVWEGIADLDDLLDADPLRVTFSDTIPASNGHLDSVPIRAKRFEVVGDPPLPISAPIPLLDMSIGFGGLQASGTFALDTGAAISFISSAMAEQLGLDSNMDGEFGQGDEQFEDTLPIGGIGGTIEAPVFLIDRITVPTEQGVDLVWNLDSLLSVLVVDIHPEIDGILGADLLTSGWVDLVAILLGEGDPSPGPVQQFHFDFRQFSEDDDAGTLYFDLTESFDVVQSPMLRGDYNGNGMIDPADYSIWRDAMAASNTSLLNDPTPGVVDESDFLYWRAHLGETFDTGGLPGDYNGNGQIDAADYTMWRDAMTAASTSLLNDPTPGVVDQSDLTYWREHFGETLGGGAGVLAGGAVPEPSPLAMLLAIAAMAVVCRRSLGSAIRPVPCAALPRCANSWQH